MFEMILTANLYIFGDSLSSPTGCEWAKHVTNQAVHNYAQAGLTLDALDVPAHLKLREGPTAVIFIGANDAGIGTPKGRYKAKLRSLVFDMKQRGADVLLVGSEYLGSYEQIQQRTAKQMNVTYVRVSWTETVDGVHPTCDEQYNLYQQIGEHL